MRLLFLAPQSPFPPNKGTAIRNFNLIRHLAPRHEVHLICFADALTGEQERELLRYCASVQAVPQPPRRSMVRRLKDSAISTVPDLALRLASPPFVDVLARTLQSTEVDLVQIEGLEMAPHWLAAGGGRSPRPLVVLDEHNAEYLLQQRSFTSDAGHPSRWAAAGYSLVQWLKLMVYERVVCRQVDGVVAVSAPDARALEMITKVQDIALVPNGVDTEGLRPLPPPSEPALLFTGTMDFRPNVDAVRWFCRDVFPLIRRERPETLFYIVGQRPVPEVLRLQGQPGVVVTGAVDDILPYWERAALCVVPMRMGGGVRLKVLEAMALGRPLVSTSLGCDGVDAVPGEHYALADDSTGFARRVGELLDDGHSRRSLAAQARRLVERRYDWRIIVPGLEEYYHQLVKRAEA